MKKQKNNEYGFGRIVRLFMISKNMTAKELAQKAETDPSYISEIINNKKNPSLDSITRIADALDVSAETLMHFYQLDRSGEKPRKYEELLLDILAFICGKKVAD